MTTSPTTPKDQSLAGAIQKNEEAAKEVQKAADDLAVAHAVLDVKVAKKVDDADAKRAIAETARVEKDLAQSAEKLAQVNQTLKGAVPR